MPHGSNCRLERAGSGRGVFLRAIRQANNPPFAAIARTHIQAVLDKRADRPASANTFLNAMRGLFAWAVLNAHVEHDPTAGVRRLRYRSDGFAPWTPEDVQAFRARHPIGSKARLVMELILLTGLRRSDVVRVGRQHLRGDVLTVRTAKTGATVTIRLPQYLLDLIESTPTGSMHFVISQLGRPFSVVSFGNWFGARCREAGVKKSAHGLRKLSATLAANGGATAHQLKAQFGWSKLEQAEIYTAGANRTQLGKESSEIVADQIASSIPRTSAADAPHLGKKTVKSHGWKGNSNPGRVHSNPSHHEVSEMSTSETLAAITRECGRLPRPIAMVAAGGRPGSVSRSTAALPHILATSSLS